MNKHILSTISSALMIMLLLVSSGCDSSIANPQEGDLGVSAIVDGYAFLPKVFSATRSSLSTVTSVKIESSGSLTFLDNQKKGTLTINLTNVKGTGEYAFGGGIAGFNSATYVYDTVRYNPFSQRDEVVDKSYSTSSGSPNVGKVNVTSFSDTEIAGTFDFTTVNIETIANGVKDTTYKAVVGGRFRAIFGI